MSDFTDVATRELTGKALDWAVAAALNGTSLLATVFPTVKLGESFTIAVTDGRIKPTTDWGQTGPILDKFTWALPYRSINRYYLGKFEARTPGDLLHNGDTPLVAACRAIVATELGETVMVPAELVLQSSR